MTDTLADMLATLLPAGAPAADAADSHSRPCSDIVLRVLELRNEFVERCVDAIAASQSVPQSLKLLKRLLAT